MNPLEIATYANVIAHYYNTGEPQGALNFLRAHEQLPPEVILMLAQTRNEYVWVELAHRTDLTIAALDTARSWGRNDVNRGLMYNESITPYYRREAAERFLSPEGRDNSSEATQRRYAVDGDYTRAEKLMEELAQHTTKPEASKDSPARATAVSISR